MFRPRQQSLPDPIANMTRGQIAGGAEARILLHKTACEICESQQIGTLEGIGGDTPQPSAFKGKNRNFEQEPLGRELARYRGFSTSLESKVSRRSAVNIQKKTETCPYMSKYAAATCTCGAVGS